ncbi:ISPsy26, transposase orfB [Thauera sp. 27]|uniref:IS3 family transposase n=1 Tax=Thauera sp. 27 TaxID=305700 RepID=UPI0002CF8F4B|nr:IS3 family transposase [Thauera sp. 27]ENO82290.1 ISPsy26, transposase orfB [Thauera sp. 27]
MRYAFIDAHTTQYPVRHLCSTVEAHPIGYDKYKQHPFSERSADDDPVGVLIAQCWETSGLDYGYCKIHNDLRDIGEPCGKHRMAPPIRLVELRSDADYGRRPGRNDDRPKVVAPNVLKRQLGPTAPNKSWVTDITYLDDAG